MMEGTDERGEEAVSFAGTNAFRDSTSLYTISRTIIKIFIILKRQEFRYLSMCSNNTVMK